jgi:drug/metabolite transporter (DMT)-like permease
MSDFISKNKYYLLLHLIVFIWGFTGILGGLISLSAVSLVWYRMIIAVVGVYCYKIFRKTERSYTLKELARAMFVGLIIALHWVFFYQSIKSSTISIAVVCLSFATFFSSLIEPFFFKRRIYPYELIFGILVVIGLIFIFNFQPDYSEGIFYGVISASLSALFTVLNGKLAKSYDAISLSFYELLGGFLGISAFLVLSSKFTPQLFQVPFSDLIYLFLLGIVCTAFAFVGSVLVMKHLSPYTVVISTNLEPVYTIILAYFIFGDKEKMNIQFYIGTIFIVLILFANAYFKRKGRESLS